MPALSDLVLSFISVWDRDRLSFFSFFSGIGWSFLWVLAFQPRFGGFPLWLMSKDSNLTKESPLHYCRPLTSQNPPIGIPELLFWTKKQPFSEGIDQSVDPFPVKPLPSQMTERKLATLVSRLSCSSSIVKSSHGLLREGTKAGREERSGHG